MDPEWQETLERLLQKGGTRRTHPEKYTLNDLNARWVSEPGLYDLASSSKLPAARAFRKCVFGEILPSIRSTGSYSVHPATAAANQNDGWLDKRLEGKELMKMKRCQPAAADCRGVWAARAQAVCNSSQPHQPGGARLHTDHDQLQKAALATAARQHPRHTEHAGASSQVLC